MLRRLLTQSGTYAFASAAAKASGFVLLLFYLDPALLPRADFGLLGLLDAVRLLALLVAGMGLPLGLITFASGDRLAPEDRAAVPATALALSALSGTAVALGGWAFAAPLATLLLGDAARAPVVALLALHLGLRVVAEMSFTELRRRERAGLYVLASAGEMLLLVVSVSYFLVVRGEGLEGVMKGYALSAGATALVLTALLLRHTARAVRWRLARPLLAFGLPLIASGLAARFLSIGDRFLVVYFLGAEANAVYELAARLGSIVNLFLVQSFQLAFTVLGLKALGGGAEPALHRRAFRHFCALAGLAVLGLTLFADDAARLVSSDPAYADVEGLVLLIAGGFGFYGLYFIVVNVLYAAGRTGAVALSVGAAAALNAALNVVLIPLLGLAGAALATLLAYGALAVWTGTLAERTLRAGYPWTALAAVAALVTLLWLAALPSAAWPLAGRLAWRAALVVAYVPLLVPARVYGRADLTRLRALLAARRAPR